MLGSLPRWRGLPDILPALPLFAQLRRYTLAVIAAAESAANIAVLMKTNAPAGGEAAEVTQGFFKVKVQAAV